MIDPLAAAMLALVSQSPAAAGLLFLAGLVTSIGPCIAPRYVAVAALVNGDRRPLAATAAFVLGLIAAFVSLGFVAGLLGTLWTLSGVLYLVLSAGLISAGCVTLVKAAPHEPGGCTHPAPQFEPASPKPRSLGAIFLLGASSALVVSPCCTPIVAAIVGTSTALGKPALGALLLLCYAAGHALPLLFAGSFGAGLTRAVSSGGSRQAPAIVSAVLMLALGMYYGVLA